MKNIFSIIFLVLICFHISAQAPLPPQLSSIVPLTHNLEVKGYCPPVITVTDFGNYDVIYSNTTPILTNEEQLFGYLTNMVIDTNVNYFGMAAMDDVYFPTPPPGECAITHIWSIPGPTGYCTNGVQWWCEVYYRPINGTNGVYPQGVGIDFYGTNNGTAWAEPTHFWLFPTDCTFYMIPGFPSWGIYYRQSISFAPSVYFNGQ